MMRSLFSGVSGLKTHQTKMDVIGNNIANVNTVAYKSQAVTFSELLYQTASTASGPNATTGVGGTNARQIGLGVKSGAFSTAIESAGSTQTTNNPFDIQITGDSFFIVSDGSNNYFTRDGSFYVDGGGNLCMSSTGYNVMGWQVDPNDGTIKQETVQPLRVLSSKNMTYPAEATTKAYVGGIIDKAGTNVNSTSGQTIKLQFYDSLGYKLTAKMTMKSTATDGEYLLELADVTDSTGASVMEKYGASLGATFSATYPTSKAVSTLDGYTLKCTTHGDDSGAAPFIISSNPDSNRIHIDATIIGTGIGEITAKKIDESTSPITETELTEVEARTFVANAYGYESYDEFSNEIYDVANSKTLGGDLLTLMGKATKNGLADTKALATVAGRKVSGAIVKYSTDDGSFISVGGGTNSAINLYFAGSTGDGGSDAGNLSTIAIDFATSTNVNNDGTPTIAATSGDVDGKGAGREVGDMSGITISKDGIIFATYDNGQKRLLGQIAVASFANASGLSKEGDNLYAATQNSGAFDGVGKDISSDSGYMTTGCLEMSNVDLSSEFTEMITTQRGFQANSRIITVSDTMLEELVNLKR